MPITKSAIKALKQSKKRRVENLKKKKTLKEVVKKTATAEDLVKAQSAIDKIAKTGYIHKNKAARLKSRLAKRVAAGPAEAAKPVARRTKAAKKSSKKK